MSSRSQKEETIKALLEPLTFEDIEYLYKDQKLRPDYTKSHDELKAELLNHFIRSGYSFNSPYARLHAAKKMKEYLRVVEVVKSSSSLSEEDKKSILFSMSFHRSVLNSHLDP